MLKTGHVLASLLLLGSLAAAKTQLILDTRQNQAHQEIPKTEAARVLKETRKYLRSAACREGGVLEKITGSFTRPKATQVAYLVDECNKLSKDRMVIYENGKIIKVLSQVGDDIANVSDLNGDGVDELLFVATMNDPRGGLVDRASIVTLAQSTKPLSLLDLNEALYVECGSSDMGLVYAYRIMAATAKKPSFTIERYKNSSNCNLNTVDYQFLGKTTVLSQR